MMKLNTKYRTRDIIDISYASAEIVVEKITNAWKKYGKNNVMYTVDVEYGYDNSSSAVASLYCYRDMTAEEIAIEDKRLSEQELQRESWERKQYEVLRKKFEK